MQNRIKQLLKRKGRSSKWLADELDVHPTTISRLISGKMSLDTDWMQRIAGALAVHPAELLADVTTTAGPAPKASNKLSADVPVMGTAAGAPLSGGVILIDQSDPIAWVRRPPGAALARELYALHVVNSSMEPRYFEGELIYIDPHREARANDHVVVLTERYAGSGRECYVKKLVRQNSDKIVLLQYNPHATIEIARKHILAVHRILSNNELYGL